ncbi:glycosyltransferase [Neobacillus mesonae]|nr:glycosyltransferase [Neobacillus mesonae]
MNVLAYLMLILCGILAVQLVFAIWNKRQLPRLGEAYRLAGRHGSDQEHSELVKVSVLIPARNEELHIRECLSSVLAADTDGIELEVLVLNDRSEDMTGSILEEMAAKDSRLRIIDGRELPPGWMGKSYACHQLAEQASGVWWLFMDADVRLEQSALTAVLATALDQNTGLVTGFPRQVTGTWLEKLVVPMMKFTIISHLPIRLVRGSGDARFVAATGAFMFIHRDTYALSGGHAAIRADLLDDMQLARAVKRAGEPVTLADVHRHTHTRMYQNAGEVWNGYKKNLYEGLGRSGVLLACVLLMYSLLYLLPPVSLAIGIFSGDPLVILYGGVATLLGMSVKRVADQVNSQPLWLMFLHPVSIACVILIGISSWLGAVTGKGYTWKGRRYS